MGYSYAALPLLTHPSRCPFPYNALSISTPLTSGSQLRPVPTLHIILRVSLVRSGPSLFDAGIQALSLFPLEKLPKQLFFLIVHHMFSAGPLPVSMLSKAPIAPPIAVAGHSGSRGRTRLLRRFRLLRFRISRGVCSRRSCLLRSAAHCGTGGCLGSRGLLILTDAFSARCVR